MSTDAADGAELNVACGNSNLTLYYTTLDKHTPVTYHTQLDKKTNNHSKI